VTQGQVISLAWNPNGKQLASGGADRSVRIWEIPAVQQPIVLAGPPEAVRSLTWSNNDLQLTSISNKDGGSTAWNRTTKMAVLPNPSAGHPLGICQPQWSIQGHGIPQRGSRRYSC